jgi:acyl-CoA dehydrogenase
MHDLIHTLFSGSEHYELYTGVIDTIEGITRKYPEETWKQVTLGDPKLSSEVRGAINDAGLLRGLGVDEKYGGLGGGLAGQVLVTDMLSQAGFLSPADVLSSFSRAPLLKHGSPSQIEKYAVPSIAGDKSFCICVTEPNAGSNTFNISTKAVKRGNKWILNGQKAYITQAADSDYGFLVAKTELDRPGALSVFVLDMKSPGIELQEMNIRLTSLEKQYTVFFDDVEMPEDALVGEEGQGGKYMFAGLNSERLLVGAMSVGISDLALRETAKYVKDRVLFGDKSTGSYQGVQHPLAQYKADTVAARLLTYHGAHQYDKGGDAGLYSNIAKLQGSLAACNMVDAAMQFHGGSAMDEDNGLLSLWRYARLYRIAPINNEMILNYIAQHGIGLPKSY